MTRTNTHHSRSWTLAAAWTSLGLWAPAVFGLIVEEPFRRSWHDIWFWPGLVPARYFGDELYDSSFVWATVLSMVLITVVTRRRRWVGVGTALLQGAVSMGYLKLLLTM